MFQDLLSDISEVAAQKLVEVVSGTSSTEAPCPEIPAATVELLVPDSNSSTQTALIVVVVVFGVILVEVVCICVLAVRVPG